MCAYRWLAQRGDASGVGYPWITLYLAASAASLGLSILSLIRYSNLAAAAVFALISVTLGGFGVNWLRAAVAELSRCNSL